MFAGVKSYIGQFSALLSFDRNCKMFKRNAVTRSLHAPRGMRITELNKNPRVQRKMSWSGQKVRGAASEGALTHKPVVLKEGFLYKPGFFRLVRTSPHNVLASSGDFCNN